MRYLLTLTCILALGGCACLKENTCLEAAPCPEQLMKCMPDPTPRVPCYYPHHVKIDGAWQKHFVPTHCHPACVDADMVRKANCGG